MVSKVEDMLLILGESGVQMKCYQHIEGKFQLIKSIKFDKPVDYFAYSVNRHSLFLIANEEL